MHFNGFEVIQGGATRNACPHTENRCLIVQTTFIINTWNKSPFRVICHKEHWALLLLLKASVIHQVKSGKCYSYIQHLVDGKPSHIEMIMYSASQQKKNLQN